MKPRIECALLKNILDGTPVIPVFVAEKGGDDNHPVYTPVKRVVDVFPAASHLRSKNGVAMTSFLRYLICVFLYSIFSSPDAFLIHNYRN